MGQVFRKLYYHAVWATKNRDLQLVESLRSELFEIIQEKCRRLGCQVHAVNAVEDHVHLALEIPPSRAVAFVIGQIKGASAHEINELHPAGVHWQDGYGVVTFRQAELKKVIQYIATQEERHRTGALSPFLETWDGQEDDSEEG